jgi:intracellular multiplication protein IcmL
MSDGLETVILRNDFYRDGYRKSLSIVLFLLISNVLLAFAVLSLYAQKPEARFFATSSDGRIIPVQPLSVPGLSSAEILDWTTKAAIKTYSYDHVNYRASLQDVSEMFTGTGWTKFQEALTKSRMLKTVIAQKLVMTAVPTGAPIVLEEGVRNARYMWKIQIPMLLKLQGAQNITQPIKVTVLVQRVSLINNPKGVAIVNYVVSEG